MDFSLILSVILGLGLSSAVGFRIFVPALITSGAAYFGKIELAEGMLWMGSLPAVITFSVATVIEIVAYYVPFVDNLIDTIAAPAAAICGTLLMGSTIVEMEPLIKWPISIIAGGGMATAIHTGSATVRAASTGFTAGIGNPVVSTVETILATILSILSIVLPVAAAVVIVWLIVKIVKSRIKKAASTN
jgi:hypothetical protein